MNVQRKVRFNVVLYFHKRLVILGGVQLLLLLIHWRLVDMRHVHAEVGPKSSISLRGTASHLNLAWSWCSLICVFLVLIVVPHHVHILNDWLD
jgi:hypothetical protein